MVRVMADTELGGGNTNVNLNSNINSNINSSATTNGNTPSNFSSYNDYSYGYKYVGDDERFTQENALMLGVSGLEDFHEAVRNLTSGNAFGYIPVDIPPRTVLNLAGEAAGEIRYIFEDVNKTISEAWSDVADFCVRVNRLVINLMQTTAESMELFIRESMYNEKEIVEIATQTNELSNQILRDLNSSLDTFYNS